MRSQTQVITSPDNAPSPQWMRGLIKTLRRIESGSLELALSDARSYRFSSDTASLDVKLNLHRPFRFLWKLRKGGDLGFAESYMAGDWDSPDLAKLLLFMLRNEAAIKGSARRGVLTRMLTAMRHHLRRNNLTNSRKNISYHYDLGNDFYEKWLDSSMTYSAALFAGESSLERAQEQKYARLLDSLEARSGDHILEIGCGWGGFAEHAARRGFQVTAITLSQQQLDYARERIHKAGLEHRVELRLQDYRHVREQFDHVVSIEMFEAVGREYWPTYFTSVQQRLKPGGRAALQVITIDESDFERYAREPGGFIQTYIFPGGMLPSIERLQRHSQDAGLIVEALQRFGRDYAETLRRWRLSFETQHEWMQAHGYDQRFRRMWRYYLAFCEAGFDHGRIDVVHCLLRKT